MMRIEPRGINKTDDRTISITNIGTNEIVINKDNNISFEKKDIVSSTNLEERDIELYSRHGRNHFYDDMKITNINGPREYNILHTETGQESIADISKSEFNEHNQEKLKIIINKRMKIFDIQKFSIKDTKLGALIINS
eukprot:TRINITY_DN4692_c0_g4_i1.p1 TRINITY_DN4692_c0_g4~~TRINITY_DN4692_c0_g4_i1.p1  ORF type:complete len:138 (+),score=11.06 TRINITY_DN4692_c0_g4_i1:162-575(+)